MAAWNFKGRKGRTYTQISSDTSERTIIPAYSEDGVPIRANIYGLILANTSASVCKVIIKDGLAGGTATVIEVPATDTKVIGCVDPEKSILTQDVGNSPWTATCTSVAAMEVTALFTKD